jgi:hypothetical protein
MKEVDDNDMYESEMSDGKCSCDGTTLLLVGCTDQWEMASAVKFHRLQSSRDSLMALSVEHGGQRHLPCGVAREIFRAGGSSIFSHSSCTPLIGFPLRASRGTKLRTRLAVGLWRYNYHAAPKHNLVLYTFKLLQQC